MGRFIDKNEFAKVALNENIEVFIVSLTFLGLDSIYLTRKAQILLLLIRKVIILDKYFHFVYIFLEEKALELLE